MKKIIFVFVAAFALVACSSRQVLYKGNVKLTQDGKDCVLELARNGDFADRAFDKRQKIVHRNTKCADIIGQCESSNCAPARPRVSESDQLSKQPQVAQPAPAPQPTVVIVPVRVEVNNEVRNETQHLIHFDRAIEEMRARHTRAPVRPEPQSVGCRPAQPCGRPHRI
jgi:hypothetical protein